MTQRLWIDADPVEPRISAGALLMSDDIINACFSMARVMDLANRAAQLNIPVIVEGEKGVGKEMVARAIHAASNRAHRPFIKINCAAIADPQDPDGPDVTLLAADGATIYFDSIGDLSLKAQERLLRLVERGEFEIAGVRKAQKVDIRLILATDKDLIAAVKKGTFREDLYYRLNVFPIVIPALRKRKEEIAGLARAFAAQSRLNAFDISAQALALLTQYDWPGNIRQLQSAILTAMERAQSSTLTIGDFWEIAPQLANVTETDHQDALREPLPVDCEPMPSILPPIAILTFDKRGDIRPLADVERDIIRFALDHYHGHMSLVARKLGIGRSTLYRKLKTYGIGQDDPLRQIA